MIPPPPDAPEPEPPEPEPSFCREIVFNSSNDLTAFDKLSLSFFELPAAEPMLPDTSSAPLAASEKSSAIPALETVAFHPKIFPSAFTTFTANSMMLARALFNAVTSGFNALINAVPKTLANCVNCSLSILMEFAHVPLVLAKSPCAAAPLSST